ncbi:MAG: hypothetical protein B6U97_03195 [Candidatus Altiarchaeales archaeon ex4484_96]|nr:MAG: hypothetical protein B6U97_03195 [Candidatus Altiarchaeales archaeon ex4484_96]
MDAKPSEVRRVVLDVLKPHSPDIVSFARQLSSVKGIEGVNISVYEMDKEVENVKITLLGKFNDIDHVRKVISRLGGSIHSIDEVAAGRREVREEETLHDRYSHSG